MNLVDQIKRLPALRAPFPYFGSKADIADRVWQALGAPRNFVDPFCGSCAMLYARPGWNPDECVETVNDAWGFVPNFLRAVRANPRAVARWADWPVSELDMHARHRWLLRRMDEGMVERLRADPDHFDARAAGYWVWGQSIWIGSGWCVPGQEQGAKLPHLAGAGTSERDQNPHFGKGIFRKELPQQIPALAGGGGGALCMGRGIFRKQLPVVPNDEPVPRRRDILAHYFGLIAARLERVRIICGDWKRVLTPAVTVAHGRTGVFLDPPYGAEAQRTLDLWGMDSETVSAEVRAWCRHNGENDLFRIVLCGYEGEHEELGRYGWRCVPWRAHGGYGNQDGENANAGRERLWLSPHCLGGSADLPLFHQR